MLAYSCFTLLSVSALLQSESAACMQISPPVWVSLPVRCPQSNTCARYTVGSHWLSVLYTVVCIRQPQSPHLAHSALFPVVSTFVPYICVSISPGSFSSELCPVTRQHVANEPTQTPFRGAVRGSDRTGSRSHSAQLSWTHSCTGCPAG